jgi:hypothetical protein
MAAPAAVASASRLLLLLLLEVNVLGEQTLDETRTKGAVVKADENDDVVMTAAIRVTRSHRRLLCSGMDSCCCRCCIMEGEAASTLYTLLSQKGLLKI